MKRAIGNPAPDEQRYQDDQRERGCASCALRGNSQQGGRTEIHHRTIGDLHGQKQLGHRFTIPLCSWCHRAECLPGMTCSDMLGDYGLSFARHKVKFLEEIERELGERTTEALQRWFDEENGIEPPLARAA